MNTFKSIIFHISRILVGLVFSFSGFVKVIDPWGTAYKIQDYMTAMAEQLQCLNPVFSLVSEYAFVCSLILAAVEMTIGLNLVIANRVRQNAFIAALFMLFMTPLTLWIALKNPVHDCGCFGDALVISNWATFWKNIVLVILISLIFIFIKSFHSHTSKTCQWIIEFFTLVFALCLGMYCYRMLPIVDFRPYHIGADIKKGMEIPDDAESDVYDTKLIYEKNGVQKEFTIDNYPKDTSWHFVDQTSVLIKQGYVPPIHDFTIETEDGDVTEEFLDNEGYSFLIISYDLSKAHFSDVAKRKLTNINSFAIKNGYGVYLLTASVPDDIQKFRDNVNRDIPIGLTDKITLKTIVRYNPGVLLVKNSVILNKWPLPDVPDFRKPLSATELGIKADNKQKQKVLYSLLIWLIPVLLVSIMDIKLNRGVD